jgi:hypothetical protein
MKEMAAVMGTRQPPPPRAKSAAADWQSLHLMTSLIEQMAFCIDKLADKSAEALALVKALDAAKKSPEALAADKLERAAAKLAEELYRTEEGRRIIATREELNRANRSEGGPHSPAANAARKAVSDAHSAAEATPLGQRMKEATARAHAARAKANEGAAKVEAIGAYEKYTDAFRARVAAAPPEEQANMQQAMSGCIARWAKEQMGDRAAP